jgi:uncharacterized protein
MADIFFADTSAFFAAYNRQDQHYREAIEFLRQRPRLITTNFVVDETITLIRVRASHRLAIELGEDLWQERLAHLFPVTYSDQRTAWQLFKKFDDKRFSFTDCTSFAVMLRLGVLRAFTFDDDFVQTGLFTKVP